MTLRSLALCALVGLGACASGGSGGSGVAPGQTADGAVLLQQRCTVCHALRGLSAYQDYWGEPEWRAMVDTMVGYGAELTDDEAAVLAAWLAVHYGTAGK
jgi:mono/diheme cytochrome c family protein